MIWTRRQRGVALAYGIACHASFAAAIALMIASLYGGLPVGRGPFHGWAAAAADLALLAQFAVVHSWLLGGRGRAWLARLAPLGLGSALQTTLFALVASLQLALVFVAWSPLGAPWWTAHGAARVGFTAAYAASWLFLLLAMRDAGLPLQTGFLGWGAVVRGRRPGYGAFPEGGTFRVVRQPIYLAFTLTLWTGPVWTPDRMLIALPWTAYCLVGAALKERRYLGWYGERFRAYRARVPYWLPGVRWLDPVRFERGRS